MVCARIVGHIQYLFGVRQLDGVLPRLNSVFVRGEEVRSPTGLQRPRLYCTSPGLSSDAIAVTF